MHNWIAQEIGFDGTYYICLQIIQWHYNAPPDIDDYTTAYLKHLRRASNIIEPPQAIVPTKIFQEGWSKMKEQISTGISGLHFGHLKSCSQSLFLPYFEALLSDIPYTTVYAPEDWKKSISVMLEN